MAIHHRRPSSSALIIIVFLFLIIMMMIFDTCSAKFSRKELRIKDVTSGATLQLDHVVPPNSIDPSRVIELSWRPRVFLYKGFLSDNECDHLIYMGQKNKGRSEDEVDNSGKTAEGLHISLDIQDEVSERIVERISSWTFLPKGNGKQFQIMHFESEEADRFYEYITNESSSALGETVIATIILYLSDVSQGGQIIFPSLESGSYRLKNKIWSDCKNTEAMKPTKGNAILLFNAYPNATLDRSSSHARCPVLEGDMWCAVKNFVAKPLREVQAQTDDNECTDEDESCPKWAAIGECKRNPVFMIGSPDYYGTCRKSCDAC